MAGKRKCNEKVPPQVVIKIEAEYPALEPLLLNSPSALLPLVSRPFLSCLLELLARVGVKQVFLWGSPSSVTSIIRTLRSQSFSGIKLRPFYYHNIPNNESVHILRSDVFYDFSLQKLMLDYLRDGKNRIHCFEGQAIYYQTTNKDTCIDVLHNKSSIQRWSREEIALGQVYLLDSPKVFFDLSMRLLKNKLTHFSVDYFQQGNRLVKGTNVAVKDSSLNQRMAYLGDNTSIHSSSKLQGDVVLCQDVLIDKNTTIEDSIIFPNTYLGRNLIIKKAIVLNNKVVFLDQDELIDFSENAMISPLRTKIKRTVFWV